MANKTSKKAKKRAVVNNKQVKSAVLKTPSKTKKASPKKDETIKQNNSLVTVDTEKKNEVVEVKKTVKKKATTTKKTTPKKIENVKTENKEINKEDFEEISLPKTSGGSKNKKGKTVTQSAVKKQVSRRTRKANSANKKKTTNHVAIIPVVSADVKEEIKEKDDAIVASKEIETKALVEETFPVIDITEEPEVIDETPLVETEKEFKNEEENVLLDQYIKVKEKVTEEPTKKKCNWGNVIFSSFLLAIFVSFVFSLCVVKIAPWQTNLFVSCLIGFLVLVAISYNSYLSGKIFTLILAAGMFCSVYYFQYTYDFVHKLNTKDYEQRTYYVIALDTNLNRSIYNLNGKKIGMLKDNNTNIRRVLNTTLDSVTYLYFDEADTLFEAFYDQKVRAIIVGENYYKYLLSSENVSTKKIKVLHEFQANAHK